MIEADFKKIGERIRSYRKKLGYTQLEVAEAAFFTERAYADIERGKSNARLDSIINICNVLGVLPNDILLDEEDNEIQKSGHSDILTRLENCSYKERKTALAILNAYLDSLE